MTALPRTKAGAAWIRDGGRDGGPCAADMGKLARRTARLRSIGEVIRIWAAGHLEKRTRGHALGPVSLDARIRCMSAPR